MTIKYKYDPVDAIRYHFKEFYIWVGFFIAINGGLLVAYSSEGLKFNNLSKTLIILLGFISSFLFFICCKVYNCCITELSEKILNDEKTDNTVKQYSYILGSTKIATTKIVSVFSFFLTFTWLSLLIFIIV